MSYNRPLSTPPPEPVETKVKYTKKARHGHGKDVTDSHNIRQVAGCLPIDPAGKRILLISSSKNPEFWVIPKGGWEIDETQEHAALRETWEEAGIKGHISRPLGVFVERANKRIKAHHWIFEMEIEEIAKKYPERQKRDRRWFTYEEALLATQNNQYIQEAIRVSSLNPIFTPRSSIDAQVSPITPTVTDNSMQTETVDSPDSPKRSIDGFEALRKLMEASSISS